MLKKEDSSFKMPKNYSTGDGFVMLGERGWRESFICHVDGKGNLLSEHVFGVAVEAMAVLYMEVIVLEIRNQRIGIWQLDCHKWRYLTFHFRNDQPEQSLLLLFPQTKSIGIVQSGSHISTRLKISYFHTPLTTCQPFAMFESDDVWTYEHNFSRGNQHSMLCWFKLEQQANLQVHTFDTKNTPEGEYRVHQFKEVRKLYGKKVFFRLESVWEMSEGNFIISLFKGQQTKPIILIAQIQNNMVREAMFKFEVEHDVLPIKYNLGHTSIFATFNSETQDKSSAQLYYIHNRQEKIVAQEDWAIETDSTFGFVIPADDTFYQFSRKYHETEIKICDRKMVYHPILVKLLEQPEEIIVHLLEGILPSIDHDIIWDVLKVIQLERE